MRLDDALPDITEIAAILGGSRLGGAGNALRRGTNATLMVASNDTSEFLIPMNVRG